MKLFTLAVCFLLSRAALAQTCTGYQDVCYQTTCDFCNRNHLTGASIAAHILGGMTCVSGDINEPQRVDCRGCDVCYPTARTFCQHFGYNYAYQSVHLRDGLFCQARPEDDTQVDCSPYSYYPQTCTTGTSADICPACTGYPWPATAIVCQPGHCSNPQMGFCSFSDCWTGGLACW